MPKYSPESVAFDDTSEKKIKHSLPVYVPMIAAFLYPVTTAFFSNLVKHVQVSERVSPFNWTITYSIFYSTPLLIGSTIHFCMNQNAFEL